MPLPACPKDLPAELVEHIERFASAWAISPVRPFPSEAAVAHWSALLAEWVADSSMPLYVRKHANNRGAEIEHPSGRKLVPTDNSPAHWAYTLASVGECPNIEAIKEMVAKDRIPVAMIHKAVEKPNAKYRCFLSKEHNVNTQGWKLAHISAVGLNTRTQLAELPLERLVQQFNDLMSPANMFVVPMAWSGLGETSQVIKAVANTR